MKKLLILLLCLPFTGFTQNDCGKKPEFKGNVFQKSNNDKDYREYKKSLKNWEACIKSNSKDIAHDFKKYFDENKLDPIEGIWVFSYNGTPYMKGAIKREGDIYVEYFLEKLNWQAGADRTGQKVAIYEQMAEEKIFTFRNLYNSSTGNCLLKSDGILELYANNMTFIALKSYPKSIKNSKKRSKNGEWAGNGSGIIISKSGHIITNNHVIDDAEDIEVEFILDNQVQKFNAEIVQVDKTNDLAIIKIVDVNFDGVANLPYNFKTRSSDVGTKVYAYGYPMALSIMGKEIKVTDGIISSKTGFDGNITTYQITAPIQGGSSGGPLFDDKGNLIGINSSGIRKDIADNVGYSIKTNYVLNLIDILPKSIDLPSSNKLANLPLTEQIKQLTKYVVLVKVK